MYKSLKKLVCTGKKEIVLINLHKTYPNSADRPLIKPTPIVLTYKIYRHNI